MVICCIYVTYHTNLCVMLLKGAIMSPKIDRRIHKTKKSIRDALITLLSKKRIQEITITELSNCANINRKTFYAHYTSVENILESYSEELTKELMHILSKHDFLKSDLDIVSIFNSLNEVIDADFEFFNSLIYSDSYYVMIQSVKNYLSDAIVESYSNAFGIPKKLFIYYTEYIASGIINMYIEWFKSDQSITLETLGQVAGQITFFGLNDIIEK